MPPGSLIHIGERKSDMGSVFPWCTTTNRLFPNG